MVDKEKAIINGQHRWWSLSEIYERTENALYDGIYTFCSLTLESQG